MSKDDVGLSFLPYKKKVSVLSDKNPKCLTIKRTSQNDSQEIPKSDLLAEKEQKRLARVTGVK